MKELNWGKVLLGLCMVSGTAAALLWKRAFKGEMK